jgi:hypothetical protein
MKACLKISLGVLLTISWAACSQSSVSSAKDPQGSIAIPTDRTAAEADVAEAVFRYQFDHNASVLQKRAERYCLSLPGERMPSTEFLERFAGDGKPVLAADRCERSSGKSLFFSLKKFDWHGEREVWVRGGYWEGNLSSSIELFRVVNDKGKWVVKGARMEAIS